MTEKPLTGRTVLIIVVSAFSVIVAANLTLAFSAVWTFPGLETKNSYVASQHFDADRTAQEALGWTVSAQIADGQVALSILDAKGRPADARIVEATLGRATHVGEDRTLVFSDKAGLFLADAEDLAPGNWNIRLRAEAPDGTAFRQRVVLRAPARP